MGDVSSINTGYIKARYDILSRARNIFTKVNLELRIEDLVLVTEDGHELLNKYNKELI